MGGHAVHPLLQVLIRLALRLSRRKPQPVLNIASVEPRRAARVAAEGRQHYSVDKIVGDGRPLGLATDSFGVNDLLGGDNELLGRHGDLHGSHSGPHHASVAVDIALVHVDDRHVRVEGGHKTDPLLRIGVFDNLGTRLGEGIGPSEIAHGEEGHAEGARQVAIGQSPIAPLDELDFAVADGLVDDPARRHPAHVDLADAAAGHQQAGIGPSELGSDPKVLLALADDLSKQRRGTSDGHVLVVGHIVPVFHKTGNGLLLAYHLVDKAPLFMGAHVFPEPIRVGHAKLADTGR